MRQFGGGRYGVHRSAGASASPAVRLRARVDKFLSLNTIPIAAHIDAGAVRAYPIDFRSERDEPAVLERFLQEPPGRFFWGLNAERGIACYERWLTGEGERWLAGARAAADVFVRNQAPGGGWLQTEPCRNTFSIAPPWVSALAQGQAASLLVRIHLETGEDAYAEAALRALEPFSRPSSEGGVQALLGDRPFPEEYPTHPASHVLNGAILGLWGVRDVGVGLGDASAARAFEESVDTLAANIDRLGHRALVALRPLPAPRDEHRELRVPHLSREPAQGDARALAASRAAGRGHALRALCGFGTCCAPARSRARRSSASRSRAARGCAAALPWATS